MIHITRQILDEVDYTSDTGVIVLLAPEGVPTARYMRNLAGKIVMKDSLPQRCKRLPNDGKENSYTLGQLNNNTETDEGEN